MLEANTGSDLTNKKFVGWVSVRMGENDGDRSVPGVEELLKLGRDLGLVQRFEDLDRFAADPLDDLARSVDMPIRIVLFPDPGISFDYVPRLIKFHSVFLEERIRGVAYESDAFVHFDNVRVERRRPFDV